MENFVELDGYPNYFIAHSPPRVIRLVGGEYLECTQTRNSERDNYWTVTLRDESGRFVKRGVHRLLLLTFVPNPENKAHVNHLDGDKSNNDMKNLEWATPLENAQHAIREGLTNPRATIKEIHQYSLSGIYINSYPSAIDAQAETGIEATNMRSCALGRRTQAGYFQWRYEKLDRIKPTKTKYVCHYKYEGKEFKTLAEIARHLGRDNADKHGMNTFVKEVREGITTIYRK